MSKPKYLDSYIDMINKQSETTISVLNVIDDSEKNDFNNVIETIKKKISPKKQFKYFNKNGLNDWIDYDSDRCILLTNEETDESVDIISKKYKKYNFDYFTIITKVRKFNTLPTILNTSNITKMFIVASKQSQIIAINIFTDKTWEFNEYQITTTSKNTIINKILKYYDLTTEDKLYTSLIWKIYCDFDKYYFKLLGMNKNIRDTILYNINIFYKVIDFFNSNDIDYRADAGTLLGATKWNGFICHDIDYDVVVNYKTIQKLENDEKFDEFIKKHNLVLTKKYNKNNKCGILCIDHENIPLHIDLYGLVKKKTFYGLCHYNLTDEDSEKMYSIKIDEYESEPSMVDFGKIKLKAYSKDKIKQYLDRTYWGWNFLVTVRCPDYYESKNVHFLRSFFFCKEGVIDIPERDSYERKIDTSELFKLEKKLSKHYKKRDFTFAFD